MLLTRGCVIEENTLVGEGTQIGRESAATTVIKNCIIGKDCEDLRRVSLLGYALRPDGDSLSPAAPPNPLCLMFPLAPLAALQLPKPTLPWRWPRT